MIQAIQNAASAMERIERLQVGASAQRIAQSGLTQAPSAQAQQAPDPEAAGGANPKAALESQASYARNAMDADVDIAQEMVNMVSGLNAYKANAAVIKTSESMLDTLV